MTRDSALKSPAPLLLVFLLCVACSVKAPPVTTWSVVPGGSQPHAGPSAGSPALGVSRFTAAPEVRSTNVTWRTESGRLLHESADRWSDYPDRMVEELARAAFLQSGRFSSVLPSPPEDRLDAILRVRVLDFTEWRLGAGSEARVALEWNLRKGNGELLAQDVIRASAALPEMSSAGAVKAYQAAADDAIGQLVEAVAAAAAAGRDR